jgi:hypothetical protein
MLTTLQNVLIILYTSATLAIGFHAKPQNEIAQEIERFTNYLMLFISCLREAVDAIDEASTVVGNYPFGNPIGAGSNAAEPGERIQGIWFV